MPALASYLNSETGYEGAKRFSTQQRAVVAKHLAPYTSRNFKDILRQCERYGVDHRNPMNQTPLMAAAIVGNVPLVETLLERGADPGMTDDYGRNALHWAMVEAFGNKKYAEGPFRALYELVAPAGIDLKVGERLVRIDRHLSEYFLVQTMWALFKKQFNEYKWRGIGCIQSTTILEAWAHLPAHVVRSERNKRTHISAVLSRNEVDRDYAYNRRLFKRHVQGLYQFNPRLAVRRKTAGGEVWLPIMATLNLPLIKECVTPDHWPVIDGLLGDSGLETSPVPVAGAQAYQRQTAEHEAQMALIQRHQEQFRRQREKRKAQLLARAPAKTRQPATAAKKETRTQDLNGDRDKQSRLWSEPDD
jgi:hypothetical protein